MAAGLANQYAVVSSSTFQNRCEIAALAAAVSISSEATGTADHANRVVLAKAVANNSAAWRLAFASLLASQGIDDSSTDTAINNGISSIWNAVAGVP